MHRPRRMGLMRQSSAVIGDAGDHTPSKPQVCHHQAMYRHIRQNTPLYPDSSFIILPPGTRNIPFVALIPYTAGTTPAQFGRLNVTKHFNGTSPMGISTLPTSNRR